MNAASDTDSAVPVRVVKNTDRYLIVHKAPGVSFHSQEGDSGALQLIRQLEESGVIPAGPRLFPVHRLDRVTSGLLVFARGRKHATLLGNEFRHGRVKKLYIALSDRTPSKKQGGVSGDMERGRNGQWILTRTHHNPAVTRFLSKAIPGRRPGLRLYVVAPRTGRTHQIRVALKSLGAPILGDPLYGRYDLARLEDRTYLHAVALRFSLGEEVVEAYDPPAPGREFAAPEFQAALADLGPLFALKI